MVIKSSRGEAVNLANGSSIVGSMLNTFQSGIVLHYVVRSDQSPLLGRPHVSGVYLAGSVDSDAIDAWWNFSSGFCYSRKRRAHLIYYSTEFGLVVLDLDEWCVQTALVVISLFNHDCCGSSQLIVVS